MANSTGTLQKILATLAFASLGEAGISCTDDTFSALTIDHAEAFSVQTAVTNITTLSDDTSFVPKNFWPTSTVPTTLVCQLTVQYSHSGWGDSVNTSIWLPMSDWNGRLVGIGGGGWATGDTDNLGYPVSMGYVAVTTDGGHTQESSDDYPDWAIVGDDNINWYLFQDFAAVALDDAATLAKKASAAIYGEEPSYSYWSGCSTGGRQGHMMAQRYPTQYDGIVASAPAINWDKFIPSEYWPQLTMSLLGYYPSLCELNAITVAAIAACDPLDGLTDGIISGPCDFDPSTVVGQTVNCSDPEGTVTISEQAAQIASATWSGPSDESGNFLWYGLGYGSNFSGLVGTTCTSLTDCAPSPFEITEAWMQLFLLGNTTADLTALAHEEYSSLFRASIQKYSSVIGTGDEDLTNFKNAGGKMITWHGTADQLIPFNGTVDYYERVLAKDPSAADYYRFFPAPGIKHCSGGVGWYPGDVFDALVQWVENGTAPETLYAESVWGEKAAGNTTRSLELCAYPKQVTYVSGDGNDPSSFACQ